MGAANPRQVAPDRRQPGDPAIGQTVVEREVGRVGHVEGDLGHDVAGIQLGMELAQRIANRVLVDASPVRVRQRIELLGLLPYSEVGIDHQIRAQDFRVVRAHAAIGVQVMGVEEAPLRRSGGDLTAPLVGIPVLEREIEAVGQRRAPVGPHHVVHLRVVGVLLRRVIELPLRKGPVEVVGARQHVEERATVRVDAVGGNDVAREAGGTAGGRVTHAGGQRISDENGLAGGIQRLREIPLHLAVGRHGPVTRGPWTADQRRFHRVEEEELLAGAGDRPAQVGAVGIEAIARLLDPRAVVEEVIGVERFVAAVVVEIAAIVCAAALADDLDLSAPGAAVLRAIRVQQHPDLGDRVEVDLLGHQAAVTDFVRDDAVGDHVAPVAPRTADVRH